MRLEIFEPLKREKAGPALFFAIADGKNPQSECVLVMMRERLAELDQASETALSLACETFESQAAAKEYLAEKNIHSSRVFFLQDGQLKGNKCIYPFFRFGGGCGAFPTGCDAWWGITVSSNLSSRNNGVRMIANQLVGFAKNFRLRIAADQLPWGPVPAERRSVETRPRKERRFHRHDLWSSASLLSLPVRVVSLF